MTVWDYKTTKMLRSWSLLTLVSWIKNEPNCILIEPLLYSEKVLKINRWNVKQQRILILTVKSIYLFNKKSKFIFWNIWKNCARREIYLRCPILSVPQLQLNSSFISLHMKTFAFWLNQLTEGTISSILSNSDSLIWILQLLSKFLVL